MNSVFLDKIFNDFDNCICKISIFMQKLYIWTKFHALNAKTST
ncbi:hypothetical protein SAMN05444337_1634 [Flavobacterium haoranii]|uniref:Uncharacterized protein n=1 Tax=Flavobacterium haoranii TaxID=683124 RepID=A0A1M6HSZ9_9FLAO|nr:hypothetical protein SAMN05444337_1634 [Flavobacterium haoranii]